VRAYPDKNTEGMRNNLRRRDIERMDEEDDAVCKLCSIDDRIDE